MAYGNSPSGKPKPSQYPYGQSGGTEMVGKDKGLKSKGKNTSKEVNKGPAK